MVCRTPIVLGTLFAVILGCSSVSRAETLRNWQLGSWFAGAYSFKGTQRFSHCAASRPINTHAVVVTGMNRDGVWSVGVASDTTHLSPNFAQQVTLKFDQTFPVLVVLHAAGEHEAIAPMPAGSELLETFRKSYTMEVIDPKLDVSISLEGTGKLMAELAACVRDQLAREGRSVPAAPPPADADAQAVLFATRITSNLLLKAGLPNARLLSPEETPAGLKGRGVAWTSDAGFGAVKLLPAQAATDSQQLASKIIELDSGLCKADFASGRSTELVDDKVVTRFFTGCKDSTGTRALRYFVLHKEGGGFIVYVLTAPVGGAPAGKVPPPPVQDADFQAAAIKAAFE